ncbi:MAG: outer membrane beta-barrel protein [Bacteroidales bacterium]|nr:outer membrane beta-barrel protein [Bacteroidales bacterium]
MKKTAWIPVAVLLLNGMALFPTSVAAQSGKPVFIDSPAYVLSGGRNDAQPTATATAPAQPKPSTAPATATQPQTPTATQPVPTKPAAQPSQTVSTQNTQPTYEVASTTAAKPKEGKKTDKSKNSLARQGKLVYISVDAAQVFNWYGNVNRPYNGKGARALVNPTVSVDFDLGYYMFLGTGLSFNTTGGRLQYPSDYVEQYKDLGFSAYDEVLRAYTASYLELPIVFRVQTNLLHKHWRIFGSVSGHFGVRVFSRYRDTYEDFKFQNPFGNQTLEGKLVQTGKLGNKINPWQVAVGARIGGSYQLLKIMALRFGVGYRYGFLDALTKNHEQPRGVQATAKPQQFEIFLGLTF